MSKIYKVLLSETILIERQYFVDSVAKVNEVSIASEINSLTSSKAINAGRIMTTGLDVHMFGCVGSDSDGERAIKDLEKYGIRPTYVITSDMDRTGEVVVMTGASGDSAITLYLGANNHSDINAIKSLGEFDCIYAATSMDLQRLYRLIEMAHKNKVGVFLDFPNQQAAFDKKFLRNVQFSAPNRHEAELLLGVKILTIADGLRAAQKLKMLTDGIVVITLDEDGCVILSDSKSDPRHLPAKKVNVVDTTGSGDIFRGMFLMEYLKNKDADSAAKKAVEIATKSCEVKGVDASIKYCQGLLKK